VINRAIDSMPPLLVQEVLLFRLIWIGFAILTLAVITGSIVSLRLSGAILPMDHKTIFTLSSWLTFGILLLGRHLKGWRSLMTMDWTLTGFNFRRLSYTGSRFVLDIILQRSCSRKISILDHCASCGFGCSAHDCAIQRPHR